MALLAQASDFEPTVQQGPSALYFNPADSSGYKQYPFFQQRIDNLKGRAAPNNQKLAIWGCGWGFLVQLAVTAGYDAFGFDASAYAINKGKALMPTIANRLFVRSATVNADVTAAKADAGIHGGTRFALLVTEDLLPCLTDTEITTALPLLRGICSSNLLHICTLLDPSAAQDNRLNWKSGAQWHSLLSPPDVILDQNLVQQ